MGDGGMSEGVLEREVGARVDEGMKVGSGSGKDKLSQPLLSLIDCW